MWDTIPVWVFAISFLVIGWVGISVLCLIVIRIGERARLKAAEDRVVIEHIPKAYDGGMVDSEWIHSVGFEPECVYQTENFPGVAVVLAWKRPTEATTLLVYVATTEGVSERVYFITSFSGAMIKTCNIWDEQLLPNADVVRLQTFSVNNIEKLWGHHWEAVQLYERKFQQQPLSDCQAVSELFEALVHEQIEHIKSHWFWFLRFPIWFLVGLIGKHNKQLTFENLQMKMGKGLAGPRK